MMRKLFAALAFVPVLFAPAETWAGGPQTGSASAFSFEAIEGGAMPLSQFAGKVLLVVNTASFCGYTKQYEGLQKLFERYEAKGLVVIGVPSNDFGEQEPKAEKEIASFCQGAFGVTFPLTAKQVVKGKAAHPFYAWARTALGDAAAPRWNFHKYLVGADGRMVASFSTQTEPLDPRLTKAVEAELAKIAK
ncbi:MAG: glutathione peroxidase [Hyphomicrobiaceae bacterium]